MARSSPASEDSVARQRVVPILRVVEMGPAREFYVEHLGFSVAWEHRSAPDLPAYAQVERDGCVLHLSEHHGDATPGAAVMVTVPDLRAMHAGLAAQKHPRSRPGIEEQEWGLTMTVIDPFGNRLVFWQRG